MWVCRKTALMNACIMEKESVIWFLLTNGARVDMQNDYGYTALMWCCIYGRVWVSFPSSSLSCSLTRAFWVCFLIAMFD